MPRGGLEEGGAGMVRGPPWDRRRGGTLWSRQEESMPGPWFKGAEERKPVRRTGLEVRGTGTGSRRNSGCPEGFRAAVRWCRRQCSLRWLHWRSAWKGRHWVSPDGIPAVQARCSSPGGQVGGLRPTADLHSPCRWTLGFPGFCQYTQCHDGHLNKYYNIFW